MYDIPIKQKKSTKLTLKEEEKRLELIKKENVDKIHDILINSKNLYEDLSILYPNLKGNRHLMMARTINDLYRNKSLQNILFGEEFDSIKEEIIATGGEITDIVDSGKRYRVHTFKSSGQFEVVSGSGEVEYLVVAGGGGGGYQWGSGGGGGGYRSNVKGGLSGGNSQPEPSMFINKGNYSVIVGAGGIGTESIGIGSKGSDSVFNNINSNGGGFGGNYQNNGGNGGSGGGGLNKGLGVLNQGFDGAIGSSSQGVGGGGAGSSTTNVNGGIGIISNINLNLIEMSGGGGGHPNGISRNVLTVDDHQIPNSGGGGGGAATNYGFYRSGNGGSGIVIIRYELKNNIIDNLFKKRVENTEATGGNITEIIDNNQRYRVHTFTSSGNFEVLSGNNVEVEYLIVAGGGGGGGDLAGGGGAGGYRSNVKGELSGGNSQPESPMFINKGNYSVVIGAGGNGPAAGLTRNTEETRGINGSNSSFNNIISIGGGGGGVYGATSSSLKNGKSGGSGGGAGSSEGTNVGTGGTEITNQGFSGGLGQPNPYGSGGGGGAGEIGKNATSNNISGNGGNGLQSKINGTLTYYAAGGGGGQYIGSGTGTIGYGGLGGGGNGGHASGNTETIIATSAIQNTGSGGGGGAWRGTPTIGGNGGSGIVIIRYPITDNNLDNHIVNSYTDIIGVQDDGTRSTNGAGLRQVIFNNSKLDLTTKDTAYFDNHRSYRFSDYYDNTGNAFVKIPISYWWRGMLPDVVDGTTPRWTMLLSPYPITKTINGVNCTFTASPSTFNHNTKGWLPHFYIGKYRGYNAGSNKVGSKAGQTPWANVTFDNFRTYCSNNGADYHMLSLFEWHEILSRMVIEKCTFQLIPEATRAVQSSCVYRGINDFAFGPTSGVTVEWMDGIRTDASGNFEMWSTADGNYISTNKNCIVYSSQSNYYCQSLYSDMDNLFISAANGTNATSFIPNLAGMRPSGSVSKVCYVYFGSSYVFSGAFYANFHDSSSGASTDFGCRLAKW